MNDFSEESRAIKGARTKLKKEFKKLDEKITSSALAAKVMEIHSRVSAYLPSRVDLKDKTHLSLFDENRSSAKMSKLVQNKFADLEEQFSGYLSPKEDSSQDFQEEKP